MEFFTRFFMILLKIISKILQPIYWHLNREQPPDLPPLKNPLFFLSATELAKKIRNREISSEAVVEAFIERIKAVNPQLNAVIENRFEAAIRDARACDKKLEAGEVSISTLEVEQPLYGIPFTVKEACGLKGKIKKLIKEKIACLRRGRVNIRSHPVSKVAMFPVFLCDVGAIIGAGASLIGIGSDIAGSIRVPALFNGIFGHKPSPGIIPIKGHFPLSTSPTFQKYLVLGPMTRYAEDLILAMKIMTKNCKENLRLDEPVDFRNLNVYHIEEFTRSIGDQPVTGDIKNSIKKASQFFQKRGATVGQAKFDNLDIIFEIVISMFFCMDDMPKILLNPSDPKHEVNPWAEIAKALFGLSNYTKNTIMMKLLQDTNGFVPDSKTRYYAKKNEELKIAMENMLGTSGVLLVPSFTSPAIVHNKSFLNFTAASYCLIFNIFGFPSTQVPMGLNSEGLPIGFQVVANRNQDRLCLAVAKELERGFGGWVPPS
ncbi:fatty-acid amide hydrolase 2-B-like [Belonocnema kinseyi]|uniref:fatty-acid amide hydrolase 2-B-like n=1 Tax=Belonocnema kinseyi TaxID=2817044 RepID=UPI00143CE3DD|nr:fatty-acid amide hydrolase 2-B-like [Belonocnema kinseyi]